MAEPKRYYWLKLKNDFFDDDAIDWLEEQEHGAEYVLFYLKLCLKSLKDTGVLIRTVGEMLIPYDVKKLAEITRVKFDTAVVAMELLKKVGLVEVLETGEIFMKQVPLLIGTESTSAERMRKSREKRQCASQCNSDVTQEALQCNNDVTQR